MKANAILRVNDANVNEISRRLPNVNPNYVPKYGQSIDSIGAAKITQACKALNTLTTNTFKSVGLELTEDITDADS